MALRRACHKAAGMHGLADFCNALPTLPSTPSRVSVAPDDSRGKHLQAATRSASCHMVSRPPPLHVKRHGFHLLLCWMPAAEAAADIQQVWLNCAAFNADGSAMFEAGRAAEAELAAEFVAAGLPTPGDVAAKNGRGASKRVNPPPAV
jgi:hypothetical protein